MDSDEVNIGEKTIVTFKTRGEVIDNSKQEVTHVTGGGGGGGGGVVKVAPITSYTTTSHRFWIKTEDGIEESYTINDSDLPLRTRQIITIISTGLKGSGTSYVMLVVNHSSRTWHWVGYRDTLHKMVDKKLVGWLLIIFLPIVALFVVGVMAELLPHAVLEDVESEDLDGPIFTLMLVTFLFPFYFRRKGISQNNSLVDELNDHLKGIAETTLSKD